MKKKSETNRKEMMEEALKALNEIEETEKVEDIVKDNKIEFEVEKVKYRLRQPNPSEKNKIFTARRKKYAELVSDDSYFFRKQWIEKYKKKGIDLDKMAKEMRGLRTQMEKIGVELTQAKDKKTIETFKKEFINLRDRIYEIGMERADLLSYSIEDQLNVYTTAYTCYLVFEEFKNKEWKRVFDNYKEFEATDNKAVTMALNYINYIIYKVE